MTLIRSHKFHGNKVIPCSASNIALLVLVRGVGIQVVTVKMGSKLCEVFFLEHQVVVSSGDLFVLALLFFP